MEYPAPYRVLVFGPDTLGLGLSMMTPLAVIRECHPYTTITGLAGVATSAAEESCGQFDRCCELPRTVSGRLGAWWRLRKTAVELVIHASQDRWANQLALAVDAAHRWQMNGRSLSGTSGHMPAFQSAAEFLASLGMPTTSAPTRSCTVERRVQAIRESVHLTSGFLVVHADPGARGDAWAAEDFGRVARYLGQWHQISTLVVWRGDVSRTRAEVVVAHSGGHALLAPPLSISEIAALLSQASLVLSSDADLLDVAQHHGTPVADPSWPTDGMAELEQAPNASAEEVAERCARTLVDSPHSLPSRAA